MWLTLTTATGREIALNFDHAFKMTPRSSSSETQITIGETTETVQESMSDILGRIETQLNARR